jgi:hypothetical protein
MAEPEILVLEYGYYVLQNPPYMASRHVLTTRIATAGTLYSPLPCKAWHGYMVTCAHRVEVEVGAQMHASAPPSGAAAAAPPGEAARGRRAPLASQFLRALRIWPSGEAQLRRRVLRKQMRGGGAEGCYWFITEVGGDGFPSAAVATFKVKRGGVGGHCCVDHVEGPTSRDTYMQDDRC